MTDKKDKSGMNMDDKLNALFKAASSEGWTPLEGFEGRVLSRIGDPGKSFDIGILAWRMLPYALAASILIVILASLGGSIESLIYPSIMDPLSVENLLTILAG